MRKKIFIAYVIILHIVICAFIYNPYLIIAQRWRLGLKNMHQPFKEHMIYNDLLGIEFFSDHKPNIIIGASHMRRFDHTMLNDNFMNLAISGQKITTLQENLQALRWPEKINHMIMLVGGNDILHHNKNADFVFQKTKDMIQFMQRADKIMILTLPPVGPRLQEKMGSEIVALNNMLHDYCRENMQCQTVDIYTDLVSKDGVLQNQYNAGDDLHLTAAAYKSIHHKINKVLGSL